GKFGQSVAETLSQKGKEVLAIDINEDRVRAVSELVSQAVELDSTDEKALRAAGIENVDAAVVAIGRGLEASIMVTLNLKEIGVKEIVAKAVSEMHGKVLRKVGATRVVFPERDMGVRIAHSLLSVSTLEQIQLSNEHSIVEIIAPSVFVDKTLKELRLRSQYGVDVIALRRKIPTVTDKGVTEIEEKLIVAPGADDVVNEGDVLVIVGSNNDIHKLQKLE
ncbi:MAG: TrkA family potassium uptake protein, partial [Candidatus Omnitrophica bacterium]|nr:TrkA family potassium uptake protein [Candidatus Omnitrophota bacterium]